MGYDMAIWQYSAEHDARKDRFETEDIVRTVCLRDSLQNQVRFLFFFFSP